MAGRYAVIQDFRDEGFLNPPYTDAQLQAKIDAAGQYIEKITHRWFEMRVRTFRIRGHGTQTLTIPAPIISITSIKVLEGRGDAMTTSDIEVDDVIVYNRHLIEGLIDPDDRDDPHISLPRDPRLWRNDSVGGAWDAWQNRFQAIEVAGKFGYTELAQGVTPAETSLGSQVPASDGVTPDAIKRLCMLLVIRDLPLLSDEDARDDARNKFRVTAERTREQSYSMSPLSALGLSGAWTGDPEIDELIALHIAPPEMSMV